MVDLAHSYLIDYLTNKKAELAATLFDDQIVHKDVVGAAPAAWGARGRAAACLLACLSEQLSVLIANYSNSSSSSSYSTTNTPPCCCWAGVGPHAPHSGSGGHAALSGRPHRRLPRLLGGSELEGWWW